MEPAVKSDSLCHRRRLVTDHQAPKPVDYSIPRRKWVLLAIAGIAAVGAEVVAWIGDQEHSWPVIALGTGRDR